METTVVLLVLISAVLHPLREFWIKGNSRPEGLTLGVTFMFAAMPLSYALAMGIDVFSALSVWPFVVVSAVSVVLFFYFLLRTLAHGDLSVYYPIMRSSPLCVVIVGPLFLGHTYSGMLFAGVLLVVIGAFFLQYEPGASLLSQPRALVPAVLTMSVQGVTMLADAEAMRTVEPSSFLFLVYLIVIPSLAVFFALTRPPSVSVARHLFGGWRHQPVRFLIAGLSSSLSYYLMLVAFQQGANVAAASAVRQVSIPMSVILGGLFFKEARMMGRLGWSIVLAAGVILVIVTR